VASEVQNISVIVMYVVYRVFNPNHGNEIQIRYLGLNTKLKVIHLCKGSGSSKTGTGRQYGWTSPLFTNPETKDKISSVIPYDGKLLTKTNEQHCEWQFGNHAF
jgi:hypothetical protein